MGLDVFAYNKLIKVDAVFDEDGDPIDPVTHQPFEFDYLGLFILVWIRSNLTVDQYTHCVYCSLIGRHNAGQN